MSTFYMLVGLPGSGKSTWTDCFKRKHRSELNEQSFKTNTPFQWNLSVISTDDIIQSIADQRCLRSSHSGYGLPLLNNGSFFISKKRL